VVDDFTRECLALVVDTSLSGARVARELEQIPISTHHILQRRSSWRTRQA